MDGGACEIFDGVETGIVQARLQLGGGDRFATDGRPQCFLKTAV
jgi:hypothetical protein